VGEGGAAMESHDGGMKPDYGPGFWVNFGTNYGQTFGADFGLILRLILGTSLPIFKADLRPTMARFWTDFEPILLGRFRTDFVPIWANFEPISVGPVSFGPVSGRLRGTFCRGPQRL
jgi:hypothetical protein